MSSEGSEARPTPWAQRIPTILLRPYSPLAYWYLPGYQPADLRSYSTDPTLPTSGPPLSYQAEAMGGGTLSLAHLCGLIAHAQVDASKSASQSMLRRACA